MELDETKDNDSEGVNKNWENIVTAYSDSGKACLDYRQRGPKEWMSSDTWRAIESRRRLQRKVMDSKSQRFKEGYQEMYRAANKEVKRRARATNGSTRRTLHPWLRKQQHAMNKEQYIRLPRP